MANEALGIVAGGMAVVLAIKFGPGALAKVKADLAANKVAATAAAQAVAAEADSATATFTTAAGGVISNTATASYGSDEPAVTSLPPTAANVATATAANYHVTLSDGRSVPADGPNAVVVTV
jgi:hypothetical protein